jgi:hypothetical protein
MSLASALERLRAAVAPHSIDRRGSGTTQTRVNVRDLAELLDDHERMDAHLRTGHFHANRPAYPPRVDMLARAAADPGLYAGPRGDRGMGRWIADAILALECDLDEEEIRGVAKRMLRQADRLDQRIPETTYVLREGAAELLNQAGLIGRLRAALEPFACCANSIDDGDPDKEWAKFRLTVSLYRAARAAAPTTELIDEWYERTGRDA